MYMYVFYVCILMKNLILLQLLIEIEGLGLMFYKSIFYHISFKGCSCLTVFSNEKG